MACRLKSQLFNFDPHSFELATCDQQPLYGWHGSERVKLSAVFLCGVWSGAVLSHHTVCDSPVWLLCPDLCPNLEHFSSSAVQPLADATPVSLVTAPAQLPPSVGSSVASS